MEHILKFSSLFIGKFIFKQVPLLLFTESDILSQYQCMNISMEISPFIPLCQCKASVLSLRFTSLFYIISSLSQQKPVAQISSFLGHLHLNVSTNKLIILSLKQDNGLPLNFPIYVKEAVLGLCWKGQKLNWTKCSEMTGVAIRLQGCWNLILELLQHPSHTLQSGLILTQLSGLLSLPHQSMAFAKITEPFLYLNFVIYKLHSKSGSLESEPGMGNWIHLVA